MYEYISIIGIAWSTSVHALRFGIKFPNEWNLVITICNNLFIAELDLYGPRMLGYTRVIMIKTIK